MKVEIALSHVAVLVPSVRKAADHLKQYGFAIGKEEQWEGEGTREIYVEREKNNSLLLMEPIKPGAYQSALAKRGPGLHHLAIDVLDLENFLESLMGSGWLLHPFSIKSIQMTKTVYLARPGFPGLIEVQQTNRLREGSPFVSGVSVPLDSQMARLLPYVGLERIVRPSEGEARLVMNGQTVNVWDLI